jgi:hypothetical protein
VELDTICNRKSVPSQGNIIVVSNREVCAGAEGRRECERDFSLEGIACHVLHLGANGLEALSFALTNLDRE